MKKTLNVNVLHAVAKITWEDKCFQTTTLIMTCCSIDITDIFYIIKIIFSLKKWVGGIKQVSKLWKL